MTAERPWRRGQWVRRPGSPVRHLATYEVRDNRWRVWCGLTLGSAAYLSPGDHEEMDVTRPCGRCLIRAEARSCHAAELVAEMQADTGSFR